MNQSGLFNSFVCHLNLLSYLMRLYLNSFAFLVTLCREIQLRTTFQAISPRQRGNSLALFPLLYYIKSEVSGVNCGTIKVVSLLNKIQNILYYANKMWLLAYSHLVNDWLLDSDNLLVKTTKLWGTYRGMWHTWCYPISCVYKRWTSLDAMNIVIVIYNSK